MREHWAPEVATFTPESPEAVRHPVMLQSWCAISFVHWRYASDMLQAHLPSGLEIDTLDGSGWVGLTPFHLEGLRPPFLPPLPWLSNFPEMNLRTYVKGPAGRGIWFFSLDAARAAAVLGARAAYGLSYYWAEMRVREMGRHVEYESLRHGGAKARISVEVGERLGAPGSLALFLTERYRLYSLYAGKLAFANVEHEPWALHDARLLYAEESVREAAGLTTTEAPELVHYSPGVHVRVGRLRGAYLPG
jgi:uncharacterized protein YqjF (DUF2071 family)